MIWFGLSSLILYDFLIKLSIFSGGVAKWLKKLNWERAKDLKN